MNNYENERRILDDDLFLGSLCRAYNQAVRVHATVTAHEIRHRTMEIYRLSSNAFMRFTKASLSSQVSRRAKLSRLEKRINSYLGRGRTQFLTITWNDDALINNSSASRKKWIRTLLNECCDDFVANVDYGKTTHREHYHAVSLRLNEVLFRERARLFGFVKIENVIPNTEGSLALYVDKLCNHALKETTCKQLMYCRKRRSSSLKMISSEKY